jgi:hypothetical protein
MEMNNYLEKIRRNMSLDSLKQIHKDIAFDEDLNFEEADALQEYIEHKLFIISEDLESESSCKISVLFN